MDYEKIFHDEFNIPLVNIDSLDENVLNEIIMAIDEVYNKYPALYNSLCAFGSATYCNLAFNYINGIANNRSHVNLIPMLLDSNFTSSILNSKSKSIFSFISYSNIFKDKSYEEAIISKSKSYLYDPSFKYTLYHELGHIICFIMGLDNDYWLNRYIKSNTNDYKDVGKYVSNYPSIFTNDIDVLNETLAETFAISLLYKDKVNNEVLNTIFEYINNKYKELEHTDSFNIIDRYEKVMKK